MALTPHPHLIIPSSQKLSSALAASGLLCRNTQNFHSLLPGSKQQAALVWPSPGRCLLSGQDACNLLSCLFWWVHSSPASGKNVSV